jgi:hypothetical protein
MALAVLFVALTGPAWAKKKKTPAPSPSPPPDTVTLTVKSTPPGATVVINRVIRGQTPITLSLEKGKHLIRVSLDDNYIPFIEEKELDRSYDLEVILKPSNEFSYARGKEAFEKGDYAAARDNFTQAGAVGKVIPESYLYLGILDAKKGDEEGMHKNLKAYIGLNPPGGDFYRAYPQVHGDVQNYGVLAAHYLLGGYYARRYDWGASTTAYKLAIPERSRFISPALKATYDNIRTLRNRVNKDPADYAAQIQIGYLYEMKGMLFQASMAYRDGAAALYRQSPQLMETLGSHCGIE